MTITESQTLEKLSQRLIEMLQSKSASPSSKGNSDRRAHTQTTTREQVDEVLRQHAAEATEAEIDAFVQSQSEGQIQRQTAADEVESEGKNEGKVKPVASTMSCAAPTSPVVAS